ncbi:MAG: hypothetical protein KF812_13870, partial [Fimbriimonadaceae bacterium]|nr:hypothetical protein [Fimbriimonadaceae bacterium]
RTASTTNGVETVTVENRTFQDRVKFNAQFAKNFWNLTVRGGLLENTGGVGLDYYFFKRDLRLTAEAYDFANIQVRASARYNIWSGLYFTVGGENLAGQNGSASAFVGGGLFLTNDDLKLLMTRLPF